MEAMLRWAVLGAAFASACGRIGFDPRGAGDDGNPGGDARGTGDGGNATVTVNTVGLTWQPAPVAGTTILVSDANGVLQDQLTSTGSDVVPIEPGWMITAIPPGAANVYVVADVQPGDVLEFGQPATDTRTSIGTMTVDVPGFTNATATTPCGAFSSTTSTITVQQYAGCPSTFDLLVTSDTNYAIMPVTFGGTVTANLAQMPTVNVTLSNMPAIFDGVGADLTDVYEGNAVGGNGTGEVDPPNPVTLPVVGPLFGDYATIEGLADSGGVDIEIYERASVTAGSASIDLSIDQQPLPTALAYDVGSRVASFAVSVPMTTGFVLWEAQPAGGTTWWVIAPPGASATFPQLPPALAKLMLASGQSVSFYVTLISGDAWTSYAAVKAVPTWRFAELGPGFVGANATMIMTSESFTTLNL
jgi:hypothetical protein